MSLPGLGGDTVAAGAVAAGDRRRPGAGHPRRHPAGRHAPPASSPGWSWPRAPCCSSSRSRPAATGWPSWPPGRTVLGLVRWLQEPPRGLLLFGLAGAGMGLAHWYAVTVLAAFVVAALLLRGRRALPVLLTGGGRRGPAALPAGRAEPAQRHGGAQRRAPARHRRAPGRAAPSRRGPAGAPRCCTSPWGWPCWARLRARGVRVVGAAWLLRPAAAAAGRRARCGRSTSPATCSPGCSGSASSPPPGPWPCRAPPASPVAALLLACALLASAPLARARARGSAADELVRTLAEVHRRRRADRRRRPALGDRAWTTTCGRSRRELRPDVVLPPDDAPADADRVWLVRRLIDGVPEPTDDDEILRRGRPADGPTIRRRTSARTQDPAGACSCWEAAADPPVSGRAAARAQASDRTD